MAEETLFLELAETCVTTCRVLKTIIDERDVEGLSGFSHMEIEDLGRCVDPVDRKSTRLNSSHSEISRMPSSA